jgi:hypothetical protein
LLSVREEDTGESFLKIKKEDHLIILIPSVTEDG